MIVLFLLITLIVVGLYFYVRFNHPPKGLFIPDAYLLGIAMYTIGVTTVVYIKGVSAGTNVVVMAYITLLSALFGCLLFILIFGKQYKNITFKKQFSITKVGQLEKTGIYAGLILSAFVCIFFIYTVFQNSVVSALLSLTSMAEGSSLLQARKAITSGTDGYFAPGFVKQFRDILIPIFLMSLLVVNSRYKPKGNVKLLFYTVLFIAIFSMMLAGQRSIIVILFLSLLISRSYITSALQNDGISKRKTKKGGLILLILLMFIFYGALTFFLGRAKEGESTFQVVLSIIPNLFERMFLATPGENIHTYRYWGALGPTFGGSWLDELSSILPGIKPIGLSNKLHSLAGGSEQGNSPLGLPADIWFAWGWAGTLIVPFLYSFCIGFLDMMLMSRKSVILIGAKIFMMISILKIYSPFGFILYGGASVLVLLFFVLFIKKTPQK
jgi:hypothetical protein